MQNNEKNLMTLKEVALYLRVTEKTIHRLLDKNAIPATRVGKLWRFDREELNDWLKENGITVKKRILVIDDEKTIGKLIDMTLSNLGHDVLIAESAVHGLAIAKSQNLDLVFLDLKMPGIDGAELFRQIKQAKPEMQVIIITGYPESELMMKALQYGPFGVMHKPFSGADIVQVVNCFLRIHG
ncbi:MAG: response regulator [Dehalococcoidales bacterium]|nr:response regulator [Dehalococcoidales bacterium]